MIGRDHSLSTLCAATPTSTADTMRALMRATRDRIRDAGADPATFYDDALGLLVEHQAPDATTWARDLLIPTNGTGDHGAPADPAAAIAVLDGLPADPDPTLLDGRLRAFAAGCARLDRLGRQVARDGGIKRLEQAGVAAPAKMIDAALAGLADETGQDAGQGRAIALEAPEPWPDPVDGAALADEIRTTFLRHVILPEGGAVALALWTLLTYSHDEAECSPLLVLSSPEKRCGKTTTLDLLGALVLKPQPAANLTPAAVFRAIEAYAPTLLIDEADTFATDNSELRGVLNSGHTPGSAYVVRNVGDDHEPRAFSTWCPKAIALIRRLPATLEDRAIVLPMRRRARGETVARLRLGKVVAALAPVRRRAVRWAQDTVAVRREADPVIPAGLHDRAADNWRPLLAIADALGGDWPAAARAAALVLSGAGVVEDASVGVQLLTDLRAIFGDHENPVALPTSTILDDLRGMEERPWGEWGKPPRPMTPRQLATMLKPYGVASRDFRTPEGTRMAYYHEDLADAFARYAPEPPSQSTTARQPNKDAAKCDFQSTTPAAPVVDSDARKPASLLACRAVVDSKPSTEAPVVDSDARKPASLLACRAVVDSKPSTEAPAGKVYL